MTGYEAKAGLRARGRVRGEVSRVPPATRAIPWDVFRPKAEWSFLLGGNQHVLTKRGVSYQAGHTLMLLYLVVLPDALPVDP